MHPTEPKIDGKLSKRDISEAHEDARKGRVKRAIGKLIAFGGLACSKDVEFIIHPPPSNSQCKVFYKATPAWARDKDGNWVSMLSSELVELSQK